MYLPQWRLNVEDPEQAASQIKVDLRERINSFVEKIDHSFGLENYRYVIDTIPDELVKDVYKKLGPFDHFEFNNKEEEIGQKNLRLDFDRRKSGALYRG